MPWVRMAYYWGTTQDVSVGDLVEYAGRAGRIVFIRPAIPTNSLRATLSLCPGLPWHCC